MEVSLQRLGRPLVTKECKWMEAVWDLAGEEVREKRSLLVLTDSNIQTNPALTTRSAATTTTTDTTVSNLTRDESEDNLLFLQTSFLNGDMSNEKNLNSDETK